MPPIDQLYPSQKAVLRVAPNLELQYYRAMTLTAMDVKPLTTLLLMFNVLFIVISIAEAALAASAEHYQYHPKISRNVQTRVDLIELLDFNVEIGLVEGSSDFVDMFEVIDITTEFMIDSFTSILTTEGFLDGTYAEFDTVILLERTRRNLQGSPDEPVRRLQQDGGSNGEIYLAPFRGASIFTRLENQTAMPEAAVLSAQQETLDNTAALLEALQSSQASGLGASVTDVRAYIVSDSIEPSTAPSELPTLGPSSIPSPYPSPLASHSPSLTPSATPSQLPSAASSDRPSDTASAGPSISRSALPSNGPSSPPSISPSMTHPPTQVPTGSSYPSGEPSDFPSLVPTTSDNPSTVPTYIDAKQSGTPSIMPVNLGGENFGSTSSGAKNGNIAVCFALVISGLLPMLL